MSPNQLEHNLDNVITKFQEEAATACSYCDDEYTSNALCAFNQAVSSALVSFKKEIIAYLKNS